MKLNKERKSQTFLVKRERLFTRLLTWAAIIAFAISLGIMFYQTFAILVIDLPAFMKISDVPASPTASDLNVFKDGINAGFSISDRFLNVTSSVIAMIVLLSFVFLTRVVANIIHIPTAHHDKKTFMPSKGIFITRTVKYSLSILGAACMTIGWFYLGAIWLKPWIDPINNIVSGTTNAIRSLIPPSGVDSILLQLNELQVKEQKFKQKLKKQWLVYKTICKVARTTR